MIIIIIEIRDNTHREKSDLWLIKNVNKASKMTSALTVHFVIRGSVRFMK